MIEQQPIDSAFAPADSIVPADSTTLMSPEPPGVLDTIAQVPASPAAWLSGRESSSRPYDAASDTVFAGMFALLIVLLGFNFRHLKRLLTSSMQNLTGERRRDNVFDEHTANESRAFMLLVVQLCFCGGVLMYFSEAELLHRPPGASCVAMVWLFSLLCFAYYVFQFAAYSAIGYVFARSSESAAQWIKGFTSSYSVLSVCIVLPALCALLYPEASLTSAYVALGFFALAKIVFIIKGFRTFYYNFWSLLYFILYLCALEIIPILIIYSLSLFLMETGLVYI